ncbi:MAG: hypothetical protein HOP19_01620 [Acidobacteria bacterium]|nr:hypothetical protein [Acidobacteriota bacterium]
MSITSIIKFVLCLACYALCLTQNTSAQTHQESLPPLLQGMGNHHHAITTKSPLAQQYFNQGLTLHYAFNHPAAIRSFNTVAKLDPNCAMAYWGIAYALGPNINQMMPDEAVPDAFTALQKARELAPQASAKERAYIEALSRRYSKDPVADRKALDEAYATAMSDVAARFPNDGDALTLYAESLMDTMPWAYWTKAGAAKPATLKILKALETVLQRTPRHPGANHFYIHAVEASPHPAKGLAAADRLRTLVPGAGHLVHMPAHIYLRTGRYHDATLANEAGVEADKLFKTQCHATGLYANGYIPHNHHFLWYSAMMEGASAKAIRAAEHIAATVDHKAMRERGGGTVQHYFVTPLYAYVQFGKWDAILRYAAPDKDLRYPTAVWHYARGIALARKGQLLEAQRELDALTPIASDKALESVTIFDINTTLSLLPIAREVVTGEIASAKQDWPNAIAHLETAVRWQDELNYDEPPVWHFPVRHALGAVLLKAGRAQQAEQVFQEDLRRNAENGWALFGLRQSLQAQGKKKAAKLVAQRFRQAWAHADLRLTAARF